MLLKLVCKWMEIGHPIGKNNHKLVLSVIRDRTSDYLNLFLLITKIYNKPFTRFELIYVIKRVLLDIRGNVLVVLIFADNKTRGNQWDVKFV